MFHCLVSVSWRRRVASCGTPSSTDGSQQTTEGAKQSITAGLLKVKTAHWGWNCGATRHKQAIHFRPGCLWLSKRDWLKLIITLNCLGSASLWLEDISVLAQIAYTPLNLLVAFSFTHSVVSLHTELTCAGRESQFNSDSKQWQSICLNLIA